MTEIQTILVLSLVFATLPLVLSLLSVFSPNLKIHKTADYFVFGNKIDIDGFIKTSIGYSLQVSSIYLFFLWSINYGARALIVPVAWGLGFFFIAQLVKSGKLDSFLRETNNKSVTIHGFIGDRIRPGSPIAKARAIQVISLATIIGLGGTLVAEIDYSTKFFFNIIGIETSSGLTYVEIAVHIVVLLFSILYVSWGGYKAVVLTERYQVPAAYASFVIFGVGLLSIASIKGSEGGAGLLPIAMILILLVIVLLCRRHIYKKSNISAYERMYSTFIFGALGLFSVVVLAYCLKEGQSIPAFSSLWPKVDSFFGFGLIGALSLFVTNAVWQIVDISSLQRLQSIGADAASDKHKALIVSSLRAVGIEAAAGWSLILMVGIGLRSLGITTPESIGSFLMSDPQIPHAVRLIVPIFAFSISVFMLSTISTFISALTYVAFVDVVPKYYSETVSPDASRYAQRELSSARVMSVLVVVALYAGYVALRTRPRGQRASRV